MSRNVGYRNNAKQLNGQNKVNLGKPLVKKTKKMLESRPEDALVKLVKLLIRGDCTDCNDDTDDTADNDDNERRILIYLIL